MLHVTEYFTKSLEVTGNSTIQQIAYKVLLVFHSNYGPILHSFCDRVRYWSQIAIFYIHCIRRPCQWSPLEYCHKVWYRKTRMVWLPNGKKSLMTCLATSTHYRHLTETWMDRWTSCYCTVCAMHMHCTVKMESLHLNGSDMSTTKQKCHTPHLIPAKLVNQKI